VRFADASQFAPTSWLWAFGDGQLSSDKNPVHTYGTSGAYTIKLVVANANGKDSLTRVNYIRFNDTIPATACQLTTLAPCCGTFISRIRLSELGGKVVLTNPSPTTAGGYEDYTCALRTRLTIGKRYILSVATGTATNQATKAWIDANGDGQFTNTELIMNRPSAINPLDSFLCPTPTGAGVGKPLRLRIISDGTGNNLTGCGNMQIGQAEDYTLLVQENRVPPVVTFTRVGGTNCDSTYLFKARYENIVTQLVWDFGDGQKDSSSADTIRHTYAAKGTYAVTVTAKGPFGASSFTVLASVTYVAAPLQALCGTLVTGQVCCNVGIFNVRFAGINATSPGAVAGGYSDNTCQTAAQVIVGTALPFTISTGRQQPEVVYVAIDLNNNRTFEPSETLLILDAATGTRSGTITLPATTLLGVPLRMRVISSAARGSAPPVCGLVQFGEAEDYSILALANTVPPVANFNAAVTRTCISTIAFVDSSINAISYMWEFGDGDTSLVASPTHTYATPGIYSVRLTVKNAFGSSTRVRTNYITILPPVPILPAPCTSAAIQPVVSTGIFRVSIGQINNVTLGSLDGYKDYTCSQIARVPLDTTLTVTIRTSPIATETVYVWIDYNNDGQFGTNEILLNGRSTDGLPTGDGVLTRQVSFLAGATINKPLRLRVASELFGGNSGGTGVIIPCQTLRFGQMEDYTIYFTNTVLAAPIARISASNAKGCSGLVAFKDSSANYTATRIWRFGDGTTDTAANPTHQYATGGTYSVTLVVRNSLGADSVIAQDLVVYQTIAGLAPASCSPTYGSKGGLVFITGLTVGTTPVLTQGTSLSTGLHHDVTCKVPIIMVSLRDSLAFSTLLTLNLMSIHVFVDANGDGTFGTGELVRTVTTVGPAYGFKALMPPTILLNVPLRMRIIIGARQGTGPIITGPCGVVARGQSYDVIVQVQNLPLKAAFTYSQPNPCGLQARFAQTASGGAINYLWKFGNGAESQEINPSYSYPTAGTYTVTLVVTNLQGVDSTSQTITLLQGPTAACAPVTVEQLVRTNWVGLTHITITDLATGQTLGRESIGAREGYKDLSCTNTLGVLRGAELSLTLQNQLSPVSITQRYLAYLDVNNDGILDPAEGVAGSLVAGNGISTLRITVPPTAALGLLRLRLMAYNRASRRPVCDTIYDGQAVDYGLIVSAPLATQLLKTRPTLTLSPNPATHQVLITGTDVPAGGAILQVLDARGRTLKEQALPAGPLAELVQLDALPAGMYLVRVQAKSWQIVQRLVVETGK